LRVRNTSLQGKVSSGNRLPPVARVSTYGGHGERSGFGDGFRSEVEDAEAERVKEKIYGYREDVLEEFRREKRMEEPRKEKQWVQVGSVAAGCWFVFFPGKAQGDHTNHSRRLGAF
jgi:hypothetical protein